MESYFGFKIAAKYNEKNLRAAYRFSKNDALLHDLSYYGLIVLTGDSLSSFLPNYLNVSHELLAPKFV